MSEDDEVNNYICKIQRHSNIKLSGWMRGMIKCDKVDSAGCIMAEIDIRTI